MKSRTRESESLITKPKKMTRRERKQIAKEIDAGVKAMNAAMFHRKK